MGLKKKTLTKTFNADLVHDPDVKVTESDGGGGALSAKSSWQ